MSPVAERPGQVAKILQFPDPKLRQRSRPAAVTDADTMAVVRKLVMAMRETMYDKGGWGLAAIQIGVPIGVFIVHVPNETANALVFVNPQIVASAGKAVELPEGCLSFEHGRTRELITRPERVLVHRYNEFGQVDQSEFSGWTARVIQHEIEHLSGGLMIDNLSKARQRMIERTARRRAGKRQEKAA